MRHNTICITSIHAPRDADRRAEAHLGIMEEAQRCRRGSGGNCAQFHGRHPSRGRTSMSLAATPRGRGAFCTSSTRSYGVVAIGKSRRCQGRRQGPRPVDQGRAQRRPRVPPPKVLYVQSRRRRRSSRKEGNRHGMGEIDNLTMLFTATMNMSGTRTKTPPITQKKVP